MTGVQTCALPIYLLPGESIVGDYCGTGMHGGVIYLRGTVEDYQLGKEVKVLPVDQQDLEFIDRYVHNFAQHFGKDYEAIMSKEFIKLIPFNTRPYGNLYAKY